MKGVVENENDETANINYTDQQKKTTQEESPEGRIKVKSEEDEDDEHLYKDKNDNEVPEEEY